MKPTDTFDHMLRDPEFHNKELQCNNCLYILFIVWCKVHQSAFQNNFCIKVDQCNPRPHGSSCQRRFLSWGQNFHFVAGRLVVRTNNQSNYGLSGYLHCNVIKQKHRHRRNVTSYHFLGLFNFHQ